MIQRVTKCIYSRPSGNGVKLGFPLIRPDLHTAQGLEDYSLAPPKTLFSLFLFRIHSRGHQDPVGYTDEHPQSSGKRRLIKGHNAVPSGNCHWTAAVWQDYTGQSCVQRLLPVLGTPRSTAIRPWKIPEASSTSFTVL